MANRLCFSFDNLSFVEINIDFKFYTGFSLIQKQRSIESFHHGILMRYPNAKILEISSKSKQELGIKLSAFNLKLGDYCIENIFQSSKVFEFGGPYRDLLLKSASEAKKDYRLKNSGNLLYFIFNNKMFSLEPKTLFYDWIYCHAIYKNKNLISELVRYDFFTDIEFNNKKSINCQARSAAIFVFLYKNNLLEESLGDIELFKANVYKNSKLLEKCEQLKLF